MAQPVPQFSEKLAAPGRKRTTRSGKASQLEDAVDPINFEDTTTRRRAANTNLQEAVTEDEEEGERELASRELRAATKEALQEAILEVAKMCIKEEEQEEDEGFFAQRVRSVKRAARADTDANFDFHVAPTREAPPARTAPTPPPTPPQPIPAAWCSASSDPPTTDAFGGVFSVAMYGTADARDYETGEPYTEYIIRCQWGPTRETMQPWMVARRFREFLALDANLRSLKTKLPKLPSQFVIFAMSPKVVDKRQRAFEGYLAALLLLTGPLVEKQLDEFLTINDRIAAITRGKQDEASILNATVHISPQNNNSDDDDSSAPTGASRRHQRERRKPPASSSSAPSR